MCLATKIQDLYGRFGHLDGVTIELHQELIAVGIHNQAAKATIFLQGAQLAHYQQKKQEPLIWLSPECQYKTGKALRGGIPLCWPWFGDLAKNPSSLQSQYKNLTLPAHGLVRQQEWNLASITNISPQITELEFTLTVTPTTESHWPFKCELIHTIRIGPELKHTLSIKNIDTKPILFTYAFHTNFNIEDISNVSIHNLEMSKFIDALDGWSQKNESNTLTIDRETDRIYLDVPNEINLQTQKQDITIKTEGQLSAVVWNPWIEKSKTLSDFNAHAYKKMICIETGNIADNVIELKAQQTHTSTLIIR